MATSSWQESGGTWTVITTASGVTRQFIPDPGTPIANAQTLEARMAAALSTLENPGASVQRLKNLEEALAAFLRLHLGQVDAAPSVQGSDDPALPAIRNFSLPSVYPFGGAPVTATPTNLGTTTVYLTPFDLPGSLTLNAVRLRTNAALASCFECAIFNSSGTRLWTSGTQSALTANWVQMVVSALLLSPGTYYWGFVNKLASTTAAYQVAPPLGGALLPRWGTVATAAGAMPASINPAAITETAQYWSIYALLSEFST